MFQRLAQMYNHFAQSMMCNLFSHFHRTAAWPPKALNVTIIALSLVVNICSYTRYVIFLHASVILSVMHLPCKFINNLVFHLYFHKTVCKTYYKLHVIVTNVWPYISCTYALSTYDTFMLRSGQYVKANMVNLLILKLMYLQ